MEIELALSNLRSFKTKSVTAWLRSNEDGYLLSKILRKGIFYAREPFTNCTSDGFKIASGSEAEYRAICKAMEALHLLINTSNDTKIELGRSLYKENFYNGNAIEVLRRIFIVKGWSSHIWPEPYVKTSSFRAAIGLAMIIYSIYLHKSLKENDKKYMLLQCADAFTASALEIEKRFSIKSKIANKRIQDLPGEILSERGRAGAKKKVDNDPRQREKLFIYECWESWRASPIQYKSKAEFARAMLDKVIKLRSAKKIEDWCREWERAAGTQQDE